MHIDQMRQIAAIARIGSFTEAARELTISRSYLIKSIAGLERELSIKLFDTSAALIKLTPIGTLVAKRAAKIIAATSQLDREVEIVRDAASGRLRIGVGTGLGGVFLPRLALAVTEEFPRLRTTFNIFSRDDLIRELASGGLDVIILAESEDTSSEKFHRIEVMRERPTAFASAKHPLALERDISLLRLLQFPMAVNTLTPLINLGVVLHLPDEISSQSAWFETNDFATLRSLVCSGAATAFAYQHVFSDDTKSAIIAPLDVQFDSGVTIVFLTVQQIAGVPLLRSLAAIAVQVGSDLKRPSA